MKILVIGATGMLGKAIVKKFEKDNELILTSHSNTQDYLYLDITKLSEVLAFVKHYKPEVIINCGAYTDIETVEYSQEAYEANTLGPKYLAAAAKQEGAILIHFSTHHVFSGTKPLTEAYKENSEMQPLNSYGKTKEEGDQNIISMRPKFYIFRTSWLFGDGDNFVDNILSLSQNHSSLGVISDQIGSPTYTEDLADIVHQVLEKELPFGVYNATNLGYTSWYDFAKLFVPESCELKPLTSDEFVEDVIRPKNSQLSKEKILSYGINIPMCSDALKRYLNK